MKWPLSDKQIERFWSKILILGKNNCWEWTRSLDGRGYGQLRVNGKNERAHRIAWALENDKVPVLQINHTCDNRLCCNPNHLYEGTAQDNTNDCFDRGRFIGGGSFRIKVSDPEMEEIIKEYNIGGYTQSEIADMHNISASAVSRYTRGIRSA